MKFFIDNGEKFITTRFSKANYKRLSPFLLKAFEEGGHHKYEAPGYMPLSVEYLGYNFLGFPVYSIMHFYTQNGDLMRDPDMTVYLDTKHECIIPLSFRQDGMGRYGTFEQEVFANSSGTRYRPSVANDLDSFLNTWSKNILEQGFTAA